MTVNTYVDNARLIIIVCPLPRTSTPPPHPTMTIPPSLQPPSCAAIRRQQRAHCCPNCKCIFRVLAPGPGPGYLRGDCPTCNESFLEFPFVCFYIPYYTCWCCDTEISMAAPVGAPVRCRECGWQLGPGMVMRWKEETGHQIAVWNHAIGLSCGLGMCCGGSDSEKKRLKVKRCVDV